VQSRDRINDSVRSMVAASPWLTVSTAICAVVFLVALIAELWVAAALAAGVITIGLVGLVRRGG